jgi:Cu-Zn family superoxide dismutase
MRRIALRLLAGCAAAGAAGAQAQEPLVATMNLIGAEGVGQAIGEVRVTATDNGAMFRGELTGLPEGEHGFHVHQNGDCGPGPDDEGQVVAGGAAGGHWDPEDTEIHRGPEGDGHLGDLPVIVVNPDGTANIAAQAPRITDASQLQGKALMIHAGGDNYSDEPEPLGGGHGRVACGVIQ